MKGVFTRGRVRAAVGLIAAYAIALQTLFAAFAPLPASASGLDFDRLSVICFGSGGKSGPSDDGAPQHAAKFHCVLCGSLLAGAGLIPDPIAIPLRRPAIASTYTASLDETVYKAAPARAGAARAPPLTV